MAIRVIRTEEDPVLRKISKPVKEVTPKIITLIDDMLDTMYEAMGVGLAAPQVGILKRLVVIDMGELSNGVLKLVNPEIIDQEGEQLCEEGCLSFPDRWAQTRRPNRVTVKALDENGNPVTLTGEGDLAKCFCHELDHLDGIVFLDKAVPGSVVNTAGVRRAQNRRRR